jgi:hypothetical protein
MDSPATQLARLLAASLLIPALSAAAELASDKPAGIPTAAEYAVHWEPEDGGPKTAAQVRDLLGVNDKKAKTFVVQVFTVKRPPELPQSIGAIARERHEEEKGFETSYKLRADSNITELADKAALECPFAGATWSEETDLVWGLPADFSKHAPMPNPLPLTTKYSRTCSVEQALLKALPASYEPKAPCRSSFIRFKGKKPDRELKIEQWDLPDQTTVLEVSLKTEVDSPAARYDFYQTVVLPLLAARARPTAATKSDLAGTACPDRK